MGGWFGGEVRQTNTRQICLAHRHHNPMSYSAGIIAPQGPYRLLLHRHQEDHAGEHAQGQ